MVPCKLRDRPEIASEVKASILHRVRELDYLLPGGLLFPIMASAMSEYTVFAIFGAVCAFGVLFIRLWVPETRGLTLEEIEASSEMI